MMNAMGFPRSLSGEPATDMFGGKAPLILAIFGSATVLVATLIAQPWKRGPR